MQTKVKELNLSDKLSIYPEKVQKEVALKWFYLYEWISPRDVKNSIQGTFLNILKIIWKPLAVFVIWITAVLFFIESLYTFQFFSLTILAVSSLIVFMLSFISIFRSLKMIKNSYVVVTDSSIMVDSKITKHENVWSIKSSLHHVAEIFNERLFYESKLPSINSWLTKEVLSEALWWFKSITSKIWGSWYSSRNSWNAIILVLWLYIAYLFVMWFVYLAWVAFVWLLWMLVMILNKFILLAVGHKITVINDLFTTIDDESKTLEMNKNEIKTLLKQASDNDWKDSLLLKINSQIEVINSNAVSAIDTSLKLKKQIEESKYKTMFNFQIFNSWIKKQIYEPLEEIKYLLEINLNKIKISIKNIDAQILVIDKPSHKWTLELQKKRINSQIIQLSDNINNIDKYLKKLTT